MSSISKRFAAVVVSVVLTAGSASARPAQDPGNGDRTIGSRIVKMIQAVRHFVQVALDESDEMSVPHP
jgi:hypothetical protein